MVLRITDLEKQDLDLEAMFCGANVRSLVTLSAIDVWTANLEDPGSSPIGINAFFISHLLIWRY